MAYDKKKIFEKAKKLVVDKELIFMSEVITLLPVSNATFYAYYPDNSEELEALKELIEENKVDLKRALRKKMLDNGKSADNIVLYKLAGTKEERDILNNTGVAEADKKPDHKITIEYVPSNNEK
mgnify:CR=1 FL=1